MESIIGGAIIGLAVSIMLLCKGRVTGISGIVGGTISPFVKDKSWRLFFIAGLILGGVILRFTLPESFILKSNAHTIDYIIAGILVGVGTILGNGCTSGHGVCGISRFSIRSIVSTCLFILTGMIGVALFKILRGEV